jgi:hypothetical protein
MPFDFAYPCAALNADICLENPIDFDRMYRHPFLTGKRSGHDMGQPGKAKSGKLKAENDSFQLPTLSSQLSSAVACDKQEAARL